MSDKCKDCIVWAALDGLKIEWMNQSEVDQGLWESPDDEGTLSCTFCPKCGHKIDWTPKPTCINFEHL